MMAPSAAQKMPAVMPQANAPRYTNHSTPYLLFAYKLAAYIEYPVVPKIRAFFSPILFDKTLPRAHVRTIVENKRELAAMTRYGVCWPPAPVDCIALYSPGARNAQRPTMVAWKNTRRYQILLGREPSDDSAGGSSATVPVVSWLPIMTEN